MVKLFGGAVIIKGRAKVYLQDIIQKGVRTRIIKPQIPRL